MRNKSKKIYGFGVNDLDENVFEDCVNSKIYRLWSNMLQRCFSDKYKTKNKSYKDVRCCDEWFSLKRFKEDIVSFENFNKFLEDGWNLDKDILSKDCKIYSKETCCFIPNLLNKAITVREVKGLPTGVFKRDLSKSKPYIVLLNKYGKLKYCGLFSTIEEASYVYEYEKRCYLQELCSHYNLIDKIMRAIIIQ